MLYQLKVLPKLNIIIVIVQSTGLLLLLLSSLLLKSICGWKSAASICLMELWGDSFKLEFQFYNKTTLAIIVVVFVAPALC